MLSYKEFEKVVFDWLYSKHQSNKEFTFTVRQSATKNSETDYFIGTERSNYFATSFYVMPVNFPGSSAEPISLVFALNESVFTYNFDFTQTQQPSDPQNQSVLNVIKDLKDPLQQNFSFKQKVNEQNKMFRMLIAPVRENYVSIEAMFSDIDQQLAKIIELVDISISKEKQSNPMFKAHRVQIGEFETLISRMEERIKKHTNSFNDLLSKIDEKVLSTYLYFLRKLINDLDLTSGSDKVYFNYDRNTLIFGVGQRYVFNINIGQNFEILSKQTLNKNSYLFKGSPEAYLNLIGFNEDLEPYYNEVLLAVQDIIQITNKSGFYKSDKKEFRDLVFSTNESIILPVKFAVNMPLNQIVYGPPGTGKTYNTINMALSIIENMSIEVLKTEPRSDLKARYQQYVDQGQIVFTTFHQSMSYEDFVEGIKPKVEEDADGNRRVIYEIVDGIFKQLVTKAREPAMQINLANYSFDDAWHELLDLADQGIELKEHWKLPILTPQMYIRVTDISSNGNLIVVPSKGSGKEYIVSYNRAKRLQEVYPDLSLIKNMDKEFRNVVGTMNSTAYWSVLNFINNKIASNGSKFKSATKEEAQPHVLIIDEINRGNVSAIFGELITLIEESKRAGKDEALEVTLPYSKEKFSVPSNLYIIGTMNTADRSVEALDIALRRRFAFTELMPDPTLIRTDGVLKNTDGCLCIDEIKLVIDLASILELMNKRIVALLDANHQIGHSYFINVKTLKGLADAFKNCVIPLLQEYFYHDEEKIALVLGEGFVGVEDKNTQAAELFPSLSFVNRLPNIKQTYYFMDITADTIVEAVRKMSN